MNATQLDIRAIDASELATMEPTYREVTSADLTPIRMARVDTYVRLPNGQKMDQTRHARTVASLQQQREDVLSDLSHLGHAPLGDRRVTDRIKALQSIATHLRLLGQS